MPTVSLSAKVSVVCPFSRATLPLVLLAWLGGSPFLTAAAEPQSKSASLTDSQIAEAIRQLGDQDFDLRKQATRTLWAAGTAAEPALRRALEEGDPEVVRRARSILSNLAYGITPDMSADVIELM